MALKEENIQQIINEPKQPLVYELNCPEDKIIIEDIEVFSGEARPKFNYVKESLKIEKSWNDDFINEASFRQGVSILTSVITFGTSLYINFFGDNPTFSLGLGAVAVLSAGYALFLNRDINVTKEANKEIDEHIQLIDRLLNYMPQR